MKKAGFWRRKQYLVLPSFQLPIILKTIVVCLFVSALFGWSTFYFLWRSSISSGNPSLTAALFEPSLWIGWGICLVLCLIFSGWILLKITHRIAGQISRFEASMDKVLKGGKFQMIYTRQGDYFHDFENDLNHYLNQRN